MTSSLSSTLFTEVVTQRSEHGTGVWLSGLDVLAADALRVDVEGYEEVPSICYLARGAGRGHPARPHEATRRTAQSGGDHPGSARTHGGQRHRVIAGS